MRIHYLITSLESGGAEFVIPDIAKVIRDLGHELHVFVCEPRNRMAEPLLVEAGVPYTLMSYREASRIGSVFRYAKVVRQSPPDLIWTSLSHATRVGQIVARMFGLPIVSWKHSSDVKSYIRRSQHRSQLWIADSRDVALYLEDTMGVEQERIATWPLFNPAFSSEPLPRWEGTGPLRIGSSGRLQPQKNYDLLVRAVDRIRREDPGTYERIDVSIAGDGPLKTELQGLIASLGLQEKVRLMGWISDIPAYLRSLHLYVQPSAYEGMCIAAHEAMAEGLPVVATPVGEMRRSIQPGLTGILLEGDIVTGIGTAIRDFIARPETLRVLGENARAYVERTMGDGAFANNGREVLRRIEQDVMKGPVRSSTARRVEHDGQAAAQPKGNASRRRRPFIRGID
jgi:glycosyltransferase involved in cell wall biosynthesis